MKLVLLGAPGSGKGTIAKTIVEKLAIVHISTGDIFRKNIKEKTDLGKQAEAYIKQGTLVPDEITIGMVKARIEADDCKKGFLFDGFPRTKNQAEAFDKILQEKQEKLSAVINLNVSNEELVSRLSTRRVCSSCGTTYNLLSLPPKKAGICDQCSSELIQRKDDEEATILNRLQVYHQETEPLIDYYEKQNLLITVDNGGEPGNKVEEVFQLLAEKISGNND